MRVLIVKTNPFAREGITNVVMNLYRAMDKRELQIDVVAIKPPAQEYVDAFAENGGQVFVVPRSTKHPLRYIKHLEKVIRDGAYDAIHCHGNSCTMALEMLAARRAGCKMRIAHNHNTYTMHKWAHWLLKPLFHKLCTHRLACGMDSGKWIYGKRPYIVVNNGVETGRFSFDPNARKLLREENGIPEGRIVIGHVGVFRESKNQKFLVDVLYQLTHSGADYGLLLMGDGPLRNAVEQQVRMLGLEDRVIFTGVTDRVAGLLCACDLLAMPSYFEGLPLSLIEAQTNGLQCVVSDSITREVDKTGNVIFMPLAAGAKSWAQCISGIHISLRQQVSEQAAEKIRQAGYDIHTEAARLKKIYLDFKEK